ncbi:unnamed protein product [Eruca vesicaria subsp. sativa]|uniref:PB1 domain-containing protein n=1 Tax=Eruca vesicaria subsp. sativa TaxID=29727 RepID=A0ABC8LDY0_ERUVS|nr:unnamed protein product [Eruca vesicaria subsp. sativa]
MEPPPPPLSSTAVTSTLPPTTTISPPPPPPPTTTSYPDSLDSSPRSRTTDTWDDPHPTSAASVSSKLRLMCSYGGHILPRPHDKSLCYMGGDTRIVVADRNSSLSSLLTRLSNKLLDGRSFTLKYQLPSEDLDSLISVTTDEDLENMIEEYDRTVSAAAKPSRLRLFLFASKPEATQSMGQILESSAKSDDWFLNALNSAGLLNRGFSDSDANVNRLLGLDDGLRGGENNNNNNNNNNNLDLSGKDDDGSVKSGKQQQIQEPPQTQTQGGGGGGGGQDVHSMPDSPMLDTSSSFGSTSSSPLPANLPPIRVHVEEAKGVQDQRMGIEEQFARFNVGSKQQQQQVSQQEDGFAAISSPPPPLPVTISLPAAAAAPANVSNEFQARVFSDDERSDHGVPAGYRKPPTPRSQPQNLPPQQVHHVKSNSGGHELPSPHSVSSDSSMNNNNNNPVFQQQRASVYQEPMSQMPSGSAVVTGMINPSDPNTLLPQNHMQNQDPGYILHPQFEQQSQQQPQQQQQQQQFIHAAPPQYIHHHPSGGHPLHTYIPVYTSPQQQQQSFHRHPGQLDQQPYPAVYYLPTPVQPRPYSMAVPQSGSVSEAPGSVPSNHPQPPLSSTMMAPPPNNQLRSVPGGKPEAGVYTTPQGIGAAQMVHQIPTSQQQFMGYSQIHHPPQSGSAGIPNYGYEYADNAHKQMFYTQPVGHAQYQTMTGPPPAMVLPDGSAAAAKLPAENMTQQIRSSQPL